jgi:hypothetical protein
MDFPPKAPPQMIEEGSIKGRRSVNVDTGEVILDL